eukprot:6825306-Heterocapsa_arctica.AAC.1
MVSGSGVQCIHASRLHLHVLHILLYQSANVHRHHALFALRIKCRASSDEVLHRVPELGVARDAARDESQELSYRR